MKKPVIKKVKNFIKCATASVLIAGTISAAALGAINYRYSSYATDDQIETIAEKLNCDISYLTKRDGHYCVMGHNGDEPIYVYLDETVTEEDRAIAVESLDYVFGVIGDINEHYRYEIVDEATYLKKSNKTTIKYSVGNPVTHYEGKEVEVAGTAMSQTDKLSKFTNKRTANRFYINIREADGEIDHATRLGTYIHELMHLVAFADVHTLKSMQTTTKHYGNTVMQAAHAGEMVCVFTPNDYKALVSVLTENMTERQLMESFGNIQEKVANYEKEYYKFFAEKTIERSCATHKLEKGDFDFTASKKWVMMDNAEYQNFYELHIENNKYSLKIFDENYKLIDEAVGQVVWCKGVAILKDVSLKFGMYPASQHDRYEGGYIEDWSVVSFGDRFQLYNVFINDHCNLTPTLEQELGL